MVHQAPVTYAAAPMEPVMTHAYAPSSSVVMAAPEVHHMAAPVATHHMTYAAAPEAVHHMAPAVTYAAAPEAVHHMAYAQAPMTQEVHHIDANGNHVISHQAVEQAPMVHHMAAPMTYAAAPEAVHHMAPAVTYAAAPEAVHHMAPAVTYAAAPEAVHHMAFAQAPTSSVIMPAVPQTYAAPPTYAAAPAFPTTDSMVQAAPTHYRPAEGSGAQVSPPVAYAGAPEVPKKKKRSTKKGGGCC